MTVLQPCQPPERDACLHQFCYTCILQWAQSKPECPFCKRSLTWVHQELGHLFGTWSSQAATVKDLISPLLVFFGLDEDIMVQLLGSTLQNHPATFVHQLIDVAMQRCSR